MIVAWRVIWVLLLSAVGVWVLVLHQAAQYL